MAINFPNSPSIGDTYVVGSRKYTWNGESWNTYKLIETTTQATFVHSYTDQTVVQYHWVDITNNDDESITVYYSKDSWVTTQSVVIASGITYRIDKDDLIDDDTRVADYYYMYVQASGKLVAATVGPYHIGVFFF